MSTIRIQRAHLPHQPTACLHDLTLDLDHGKVLALQPHDESLLEYKSSDDIDARGGLLAPSLCHPHVHLDKAFILNHPKYRHLQVKEGTFEEAMRLTSEAKRAFARDDLIERGQRLIDESVKAGVTHLRAFVEVDEIVGLKCLEVGSLLKQRARDESHCFVQLCAFAQLPLRPSSSEGDQIRSLMQSAMEAQYQVDVVGSTPYVEQNREDEIRNMQWMIELALKHDKHLDFHLDYSVATENPPAVFELLALLKESQWAVRSAKKIVLGHCTRLIFFDHDQWSRLAQEIGDLSISFVGLPTSDLYMMKSEARTGHPEIRTTLPVLKMIQKYGLNCAIGMNNIGNAFTPQGSCDPLYLANMGVAIYQDGTKEGARLLYECVSTRAKAAIGVADSDPESSVTSGRSADFVIFPPGREGFTEDGIEDKVYYLGSAPRTTVFWGRNYPD